MGEQKNTAHTHSSEAIEHTRTAQADAAREETTRILTDAIKDAFGEHASTGRFVDVSRIPLLCKSILDQAETMKRIEKMIVDQKTALDKKNEENDERYVNRDQFEPVKNIVYGAVGLILVAVLGALVTLVVVNK